MIVLCTAQLASAYGLKFCAADYPIDQRTSYQVFGDKCPHFREYFIVEFNMALYPAVDVGYVVRIMDEEKNQIFNLFLDVAGHDALFRLNQEGKSVLIALPVDKVSLKKKHWFKVKIAFDLKNDEITLKINEHEKSCKGIFLPDEFCAKIVFGRSEHIIEVPSIAIDSLRVKSVQTTYDFPLNEVDGEMVHNRAGVCYGKVKNPLWLINEAYHWQKEAVFTSSTEAGSCYDTVGNSVYYLNCDSLHIYNVESGETVSKPLASRCPMKLFLASCFIDIEQGKLYVYEVFRESPFDKEPMVASLDLQTLDWKIEGGHALNTQLHHHCSYFDVARKRYTIFGGFGNMHYSNKFYMLNTEGNVHWDELTPFSGDVICPRYFSSVGYLPEEHTAYILGGMGNETGEQVVGRSYFHDFYKVDLENLHVQKLWELTGEPNAVPARGMIVRGDSVFYVLRYRESVSHSYLHLHQFAIKDGSYCILGDSIPILSDKISTNANLYYNEARNRLFVTVQESSDDVSSTFTIYSLLFPPVSFSVYDKVEKESFWVWIMISAAVLVMICTWWYFFRRYSKRKAVEESEKHEQREDGNAVVLDAQIVRPIVFAEESDRENSIYLFGNFAVFDRNCRNISYMFSLRIRQVLCLIIRYNNTTGISSKELGDRMWPDKPKDKVKNLRGVTINHLRKILKELDGIELACEKGNFRFILSDDFYCDYLHFLQIVEKSRVDVCKQEFLRIVGRGKFLCFLDNPLFDGFKQDVECSLEVLVLRLMEESFEAEEYQTTVSLMEVEFNIDPSNEVALSYGIRSLYMLKQETTAISVYQKFVAEYKKSTGEDYSQSFMYYWRKY